MGYKLQLQMYESPSLMKTPAFSSAVMTDIPRENDKEQMLDVKKW